jgi:predicted HNH restriction endonuclease
MPITSPSQSYPAHVRQATSYKLVPGAKNTSKPGSLRAKRWPTVSKYSGHPNGIELAGREGGVTKRHLFRLEIQGQLNLNTSPKQAISVAQAGKTTTEPLISLEDEESRFPEGVVRYRMHRELERDTAHARRAKQLRLLKTGTLACDICKFDFTERYGPLGSGYIEAHHTIPVSRLDGRTKTKLSDFALVCSNCHRMLHFGKPILSVEKLRDQLSKHK